MEYWIWLSKLELKREVLLTLLQKNKSPQNVYKLNKDELQMQGISPKDIEAILNPKTREKNEEIIKYMLRNNIEIINITQKEYPLKLKNIYNPPIVLYIKGDCKILNNKGISIIGSRNCSTYGINVTKQISFLLARRNINIISGLAYGIDTQAHIGCLKAGGKTIAVLGSGLDNIYPKENFTLAESIVQNGGAIVSEYCVGTKPIATNFPKRNRIISGLSDGLIVVEAKKRSGTSITVNFALDQGREVYAVPGNITSIYSHGTNELIKQGAKTFTCIQDVLEDIQN